LAYQAFITGASLPHIPTTKPTDLAMTIAAYTYTALKDSHGNALATANRQRAAAKGDYVHSQLRAFVIAQGYQYFAVNSIDVLANNLWFDAMVTNAWKDHSGTSFQRIYWRALQYWP
jgi:hypothetical protein